MIKSTTFFGTQSFMLLAQKSSAECEDCNMRLKIVAQAA